MKTKKEIIDETVEFYSKNPRAVTKEGKCRYLTDDGIKCAVGRFFRSEIDGRIVWGPCTSLIVTGMGKVSLDELLKSEYTGHEVKFWRDLQGLHDYALNWNENGLSPLGHASYQKLLKTWCNNKNDYKQTSV